MITIRIFSFFYGILHRHHRIPSFCWVILSELWLNLLKQHIFVFMFVSLFVVLWFYFSFSFHNDPRHQVSTDQIVARKREKFAGYWLWRRRRKDVYEEIFCSRMGGRGMGRREGDPEEIGRKETFDIWRTAVEKKKTEREKKEKAKRHFIIFSGREGGYYMPHGIYMYYVLLLYNSHLQTFH